MQNLRLKHSDFIHFYSIAFFKIVFFTLTAISKKPLRINYKSTHR